MTNLVLFRRGESLPTHLFCFQPQNILLTEEFPKGSVKICDLGFACLVNTGEDIRDIIGTPDYVGKLIIIMQGVEHVVYFSLYVHQPAHFVSKISSCFI